MKTLEPRPAAARSSRSPSLSPHTGSLPGAARTAIRDALRSPGRPLDSDTRTEMESRFAANGAGPDFSQVRLHTDAASAGALAANAYTVGNDIVFGHGPVAGLGSPAGERLLTHELAHVVQSSPGAGSPPDQLALPDHPAEVQARAVAGASGAPGAPGAPGTPPALRPQAAGLVFRDPTPAAAASPVPAIALLPPTRSSAEIWRDWDRLTANSKNAEALALVPDLIAVMSVDEAVEKGPELLTWLFAQGEKELAKKALARLEDAWWIRFVSLVGKGLGSTERATPEGLTDKAEKLALGGDHDTARELFATAFLFLQMLLVNYTDKRLQKLREISDMEEGRRDAVSFMVALLRYTEPQAIYAAMRRIVAFYGVRQREATAAGNPAESQKMADLDAKLRQRIGEHSLLSDGEGTRGITLEGTEGKDKRRGEGYTLHGVNDKEEFVTPLPGTPLPDELGRHPAYTASMQDLFTTLSGQEDFLTEILSRPEVRNEKGFAKHPPTVEDLSQMSVRIRIWQILFQSFQKQPAAGCTTALCSLLQVVGRYLKHFTTHTQYNVDDFPKVSYLDQDQPTDLAGRTLRDCGVYAVTTAYEVFRALGGGAAGEKVGFQLYHTLEHVMLVINDHDTQTHYVLSNDQIVGPKTGDPSGTVAQAFADVIGHPRVLSVAAHSPELSGKSADAAFRGNLWKSFETGAHLQIETEQPTGPDDKRTLDERSRDTIKHYYEALDRFDRGGGELHTQLDALLPRLATATGPDLGTVLLPLAKPGLGLVRLLDDFANNRIQAGFTKAPAVSMVRTVLVTAGRTGDHPLARLGMALLFAESKGLRLNPDQLAFLTLLRQIPGATFAARLAEYDKAGRPPRF